jgi:hypothetical protein
VEVIELFRSTNKKIVELNEELSALGEDSPLPIFQPEIEAIVINIE